ncbi:MAG TPA: Fic family protein [Acidimicrobiia bacterium]
MDPGKFTRTDFGAVVKTPGPHGFYTFIPSPLPRRLGLAELTVARLSDADRAIGRLAGAGRLLPNPHLLVNAYIRREAVASSRIEGTQATLSDIFEAESSGRALSHDIQEVSNYVRAMEVGLQRVPSLPISRRLLEEIHRVLLSGVRGQDRRPGEVRTSPNWIGSNSPATAVFVPPPHAEMQDGLSDWEKFVHEPTRLPPLVRCALLHYQFETLHPFLDGNGRLGRLLIIFYLMSEELLPSPLLYVSTYFEDHKEEYYDRLQAVRERSEMDAWIQFFLGAVTTQANDAVWRAEQITDRREDFRRRLGSSRSRAPYVIDLLLENPFITTAMVRNALGVTPQGATNLLRQLEGVGIIEPAQRISGRSLRWVSPEIYEILTNSNTRAPSLR